MNDAASRTIRYEAAGVRALHTGGDFVDYWVERRGGCGVGVNESRPCREGLGTRDATTDVPLFRQLCCSKTKTVVNK